MLNATWSSFTNLPLGQKNGIAFSRKSRGLLFFLFFLLVVIRYHLLTRVFYMVDAILTLAELGNHLTTPFGYY